MRTVDKSIAMLYLFLFLFALVSCQEITEDPHHTVTYNPPVQDCLPYDGSLTTTSTPAVSYES